MNEKSGLQLGKVVLKNYKAYRGEIPVDLSRDSEQTITIIHGEMGKGKTTFLDAIYWCLYGGGRSSDGLDSDENILNNDVLRNLALGQRDETYVEIHLYNTGELRYKIKRTAAFTKKEESDILASNESVGGRIPRGIDIEEQLEYSEIPPRTDDWVVHTNPSTVKRKIENLFPKSLSSYFLFDAELLDKFFNQVDNKNVKNGVEKISGLPIITDAIKHLTSTTKSISKEMKSVNLQPINEILDHIEQEIRSYSDKITRAEEHINEIRTEMDQKESYLRHHDEDVIQELQKRKDSLRRNMDILKKSINNQAKEMKNWLLRTNTTVRLQHSMKTCLNRCQTWEEEGKIPIAVSGYALRNIINADNPKCICGADLAEGSTGRRHIEELLKKDLAESPVIQSISTGRGFWEDMVATREQIFNKLAEFKAERGKLNLKYDDEKNNIQDCDDRLSKHDVEKVREYTERLSELRDELKEQTGIIAVAKDRLDEANRRYAEKERERNTLAKKEKMYDSQINRLDIANKIKIILEQCERELIDDMRNKVEKKTTKYFLRLVSKKEDFSRVKIRDSYKTIVLGTDQKSKSLSEGQRCCLALSYIAAIRDIVEKNYFMLIDSPLLSISAEERVDFAKNLPNFIPGMQITLLVQDQEYTGISKKEITGETIASVRETMLANKSVWREYLLKSVKNEGDVSSSTVIEKGDMER